MVSVSPQPQLKEDGVLNVYLPVSVVAVLKPIEFGQRKKTVLLYAWRRYGLRREVAKQLTTIVDQTVIVAVECKPGVIGAADGPRETLD